MARVRRKGERRAGDSGAERSRAPLIAGLLLLLVAGVGLVAYIGQDSGGAISGDHYQGVAVDGRFLGDPDAPLLIQDFSDFSCPHCKAAAGSLTPQIIEEYVKTGQVRIEFIPVSVLGAESARAAQAAMCAEEQGAFWPYHDILFERQAQGFGGETLIEYANEVSLDAGQFRDCLYNQTYLDQLQANNDAFTQAGVERGNSRMGTPSFLVGEELVEGNVSFAEMQQTIESQLN